MHTHTHTKVGRWVGRCSVRRYNGGGIDADLKILKKPISELYFLFLFAFFLVLRLWCGGGGVRRSGSGSSRSEKSECDKSYACFFLCTRERSRKGEREREGRARGEVIAECWKARYVNDSSFTKIHVMEYKIIDNEYIVYTKYSVSASISLTQCSNLMLLHIYTTFACF